MRTERTYAPSKDIQWKRVTQQGIFRKIQEDFFGRHAPLIGGPGKKRGLNRDSVPNKKTGVPTLKQEEDPLFRAKEGETNPGN